MQPCVFLNLMRYHSDNSLHTWRMHPIAGEFHTDRDEHIHTWSTGATSPGSTKIATKDNRTKYQRNVFEEVHILLLSSTHKTFLQNASKPVQRDAGGTRWGGGGARGGNAGMAPS